MTTSTFNAITYANKLKNAGLDAKIADVEAEQMSELINNELVTKSFLSNELSKLEMKLIIKLGGMMTVQMGIIIAVLGFIVHK